MTIVPVVAGREAAHGSGEVVADVALFKAQFAQFDVKRARCAVEEDTQRLLAVIETGFGTYAPFNQLVRGNRSVNIIAP